MPTLRQKQTMVQKKTHRQRRNVRIESVVDSNRDPNNASASPAKQSKTKKSTSPSPTTTAASLSTIHLDGEENEEVPIFATADDVRKLINAHLPSTTKAGFARELTELLPNSKVTTRNLDALLKMNGPLAGAHNIAFYAGYVFFEKIRVRDNKKKSAKREKMEQLYPGGDRILGSNDIRKPGVPREGSHNMHFICRQGQKPVIDQYGKMSLKGQPKPISGMSSKKLGRV